MNIQIFTIQCRYTLFYRITVSHFRHQILTHYTCQRTSTLKLPYVIKTNAVPITTKLSFFPNLMQPTTEWPHYVDPHTEKRR